ncbi:MAG: phosphoserine phosphatase SerB, partial [Proteus mirabilis]
MSNSLTYCYLPDEIRKWPGLPLSLSGEEVMPLDYRAGDSGWLLYGRELDKKRISEFQHKLGVAIVVVSSWRIDDYQVVRIAGSLTRRIRRLSDECGLDVVPFGQIPRLRSPGLLVMDMDSTAIQIECIDEIAKLAGVGDKVAEITEQAMQGEMDFSESLKLRVAQLAGADANILQKVMDNLPLMPGLTSLVRKLQAMDWQIAIASGGFTYFADNLK